MSNLISTGIIFLILCVVYSRSISRDALLLLSPEEKDKLAQKFAGFARFNLIPIIIVFTGYLLITYLKPSFSTPGFVILILFFISFLIATSIRILRKMRESNLPEEYVKKYRQSRMIYNLGFSACGFILLYELLT